MGFVKCLQCEHSPSAIIKNDPITQNVQLPAFPPKSYFISFYSYIKEVDDNGLGSVKETILRGHLGARMLLVLFFLSSSCSFILMTIKNGWKWCSEVLKDLQLVEWFKCIIILDLLSRNSGFSFLIEPLSKCNGKQLCS